MENVQLMANFGSNQFVYQRIVDTIYFNKTTKTQSSPSGVIQSNKVSYWFMRKKDIIKPDGSLMTPLEIKNKYALPELPTHYTNVNLPPNKQVYRGVAKEQIQQGWGNGGGIQFEINEPPQSSWFSGEISL